MAMVPCKGLVLSVMFLLCLISVTTSRARSLQVAPSSNGGDRQQGTGYKFPSNQDGILDGSHGTTEEVNLADYITPRRRPPNVPSQILI